MHLASPQPVLLLLPLLLAASINLALGQLRVETEDVVYIGRSLSLNSPQPSLQTVAHLGIPYAEPPVGELRFAPPVPWSPPTDNATWDKPELSANRSGPACQQRPDASGTPGRMSEDCLYLSVHSPTISGFGRPVLVWLHGGYFETGAVSHPEDVGGSAFAWDLVATQQNLLAVEVAYRLGVFGFLSLGNISGNAGLLDQQLALAWVARNIGYFGGDNASVTLAGLDAGAASVGFHLVSPGSQHLFQRCGFLGGSPLSGWAFVRDRAALGKMHAEFYRRAGCPGAPDRPGETLACLRNLSAEALTKHQAEFGSGGAIGRVEFPAVVDGRFLVTDPLEAFERGSFEAKTALVGATSLEGAQDAYAALRAFNVSEPSSLVGEVHRAMLAGVFRYLPRFPEQPSPLARDFLAAQLTAYDSEATGLANFDLLIRALSQQVTVCDANRLTDQLLRSNQSSQVFVYLFAEPDKGAEYLGASHGRDAAYFVGEPRRLAGHDQEQRELSGQMMSQLSSFLASGNLSRTGWLPATLRGLEFQRLLALRPGVSGPHSLRGGYERQDCRLWDDLLPWLSDSTRPGATTVQPPPPATTTSASEAEAKFWERCNSSINTVSLIAIGIGGGLVLLLIVCVVLVARGRRTSAHDSVELYQRVAPAVRKRP